MKSKKFLYYDGKILRIISASLVLQKIKNKKKLFNDDLRTIEILLNDYIKEISHNEHKK